MPGSLKERVRAYVEDHRLLPRGVACVVAVSGGQDSCALLHVLAALRPELGWSLHAAHLNHGFRGADADADAEFVRGLAASLGVPCTVERQDVPAQARRLHRSAQDAARIARHAFLERVANAAGAERIALGHTRDDDIETVVLNIVRGAGTDGLRGLPPSSGPRVRPLLAVGRDETAAYCREHGIAYREDASNRSLRYLRNRVREELLPMMATYYNLEFGQAITRLSELASDEADLLDTLAAEALRRLGVEREGGLELDTAPLAEMHVALRRRVIRAAIAAVRGSTHDVDFSCIARIVTAVAGASDRERSAFTLPGASVCVIVEREVLSIRPYGAPLSVRGFARAALVPGQTRVPELGGVVEAHMVAPPADPRAASGPHRVYVDADAVRGALRVRNRRPGDRFRPLGAPGERKLQDVLVDRKVPANERALVPIIEDADGILWVVGVAVADRARLSEQTGRALELSFQYVS